MIVVKEIELEVLVCVLLDIMMMGLVLIVVLAYITAPYVLEEP